MLAMISTGLFMMYVMSYDAGPPPWWSHLLLLVVFVDVLGLVGYVISGACKALKQLVVRNRDGGTGQFQRRAG